MTLPDRIPYPPEVAVITVDGIGDYTQWESVMVEHRYAEAWPIFEFTSTEFTKPSPLPLVQLHPGQFVQIKLGGQKAMDGVIIERQTGYDANTHGIQLKGYGVTWIAARASHVDKGSDQEGTFDNMPFSAIAAKLLAPFAGSKVKFRFEGNTDEEPFKHEQIPPGMTIWDFLEGLARKRGIVIGTDENGYFVFQGPRVIPPTDMLVEGENILKCTCILSAETLYSEYDVRGQGVGDDQNNGGQAAQQQGMAKGDLPLYSPNLTPAEDELQPGEAQKRADFEKVWHDYTYVQAHITVQGWLRNNGKLWRAGDTVQVRSPMAMLNDIELFIQSVKFTQDSSRGTLTELHLVDPRIARVGSAWNTNNPNVPNSADPDTALPAQPTFATIPGPPKEQDVPFGGT